MSVFTPTRDRIVCRFHVALRSKQRLVIRSKPVSLAALLTTASLRRLAGETFFARGKAYHSDGLVRAVRFDGEVVVATVTGTYDYRVKLWAEADELAYSCSCPVGDDGGFCKHCVAAGLAWLAGSSGRGPSPGDPTGSAVTVDDIRSYLTGLPVPTLVDLIVAQTRENDGLYRQLLLRAAKAKRGGPDLAVWRQAFDDAVGGDQPVSYRGAGDYADGIDEVVRELGDMLDEKHAEAVIELSAYAMAALKEAMDTIHDSDGEVGAVLDRVRELHLAASRLAPPDPEELAERLFEWEMEGTVEGAVASYADPLGKRGLAHYRRLAETEWQKVPAVGPGESDPERYGRHLYIAGIMEDLARRSGDIEALVEVKSRDLSLPYHFAQIARLYKADGQADRALDWAERGWRAFPSPERDAHLRDFLADAYHERGRHAEAMAVIWQAFVDGPNLGAYQQLKRHADRGGAWGAWRDKALACIRERLTATARQRAASKAGAWSWNLSWHDRSLLVAIFLWEGDGDAAWREAREGGCSADLWLKLASARENSHPQDALAVYREQVEQVLRQTDMRAYEEAVRLIAKVRHLSSAPGAGCDFAGYIVDLRATHRRKRNFIKLLDKKKW
jgi:uncharacterized Zn finger protein